MNPEWLARLRRRHLGGSGRRMPIGLITYGSLLAPAEINVVFDRDAITVRPVRVEGYARLFNKPVAPHLRDPREGDGRGVLNLRPRKEAWFNGLLVSPVHESSADRYAFREQEYDLEEIPPSALSFYGVKPPAGIGLEAIYTCLLTGDAALDDGLDPVADYLELCREGARHWGEEFYEDFLVTTLVDGTPLARADGDETP